MADPVETTPEMPVDPSAHAAAGHAVPAGTTEVPHESGGLPQFQFEHWGGQIVWLLLIFAVLYVLISKVFTPRLRKALDDRLDTIGAAIAEARRVQSETEEQAAADAQKLADVRAQAIKISRDAYTQAAEAAAARSAAEDASLAERLVAAEADIRAARDKAMASVRTVAEDTGRTLVEHLTGKEPSDAEMRAAAAQVRA